MINNRFSNHKIYRNYKHIISQKNYIKPEIADCIYLNSGHCVAVLKTYWIRIIQRKWKSICKEKNNIIQLRRSLSSQRYREIHGYWPEGARNIPSLKGMFSNLPRKMKEQY